MLQTLTDDGHMTYACYSGCGIQSAHVSEVHYAAFPGAPEHMHLAVLPPCPTCGSRVFLKIHFTEMELAAPNMIHPVTGEPTPSRAVAERHMQLANLLTSSREGT